MGFSRAATAIPLGRPSPGASSDRPERRREGPPGTEDRSPAPAAPTWSCSRWGFPCRRRCRPRGALLPHRFTLAARPVDRRRAWRCPFCGTIPGVAPAGRYPAPYLRGARTFLSPPGGGKRPSGRLALQICPAAPLLSKAAPIKRSDQGLVVVPIVAANSFLTLPANSGLTRRVVFPAVASTAVGHAM